MDNKKQAANIQPIAILIDELKHEDVSLRINAIRRLSTIALALGFERTRDELLPFLQSSVDEEDEVLVVLAEELGKFVDYVGGPKFAHLLLPSLEELAGVEETLVRDKAVASISAIANVMSSQQCEDSLIPIIKKLANGDWFTRKISACSLIPVCYPKVNSTVQKELRSIFVPLCTDESPMKLIPVSEKNDIIEDFKAALNALSQDEQDSVRLLSVDINIALAAKLNDAEKSSLVVPHYRNLWNDRSWRVRYMAAEKIVHMLKSIQNLPVADEINSSYSQLLKDQEAEVRNIACMQLPSFCSLISPEVIEKSIVPCLKDLVTDSSQHVRASLAGQISGLSPLLGKDVTMSVLLPLFLQLLKDDFHEVRLNIISKLDKVSEVIGINLLSQSLLPAIVKLAEDKQWRVRLAIIEHFPLLAKQFGAEFFNEKLLNICFEWLSDSVFAIREAATINLKNLIVVFGSEWAVTHVIPKILEMSKNENYLYRLTVIFAITSIASTLGAEISKNTLLPIVKNLSNDPIPNVRFNVAKSLQVVTKLFNESNQTAAVNNLIRPILLQLQQDRDRDVQYFSQKALETTTAMVV